MSISRSAQESKHNDIIKHTIKLVKKIERLKKILRSKLRETVKIPTNDEIGSPGYSRTKYLALLEDSINHVVNLPLSCDARVLLAAYNFPKLSERRIQVTRINLFEKLGIVPAFEKFYREAELITVRAEIEKSTKETKKIDQLLTIRSQKIGEFHAKLLAILQTKVVIPAEDADKAPGYVAKTYQYQINLLIAEEAIKLTLILLDKQHWLSSLPIVNSDKNDEEKFAANHPLLPFYEQARTIVDKAVAHKKSCCEQFSLMQKKREDEIARNRQHQRQQAAVIFDKMEADLSDLINEIVNESYIEAVSERLSSEVDLTGINPIPSKSEAKEMLIQYAKYAYTDTYHETFPSLFTFFIKPLTVAEITKAAQAELKTLKSKG